MTDPGPGWRRGAGPAGRSRTAHCLAIDSTGVMPLPPQKAMTGRRSSSPRQNAPEGGDVSTRSPTDDVVVEPVGDRAPRYPLDGDGQVGVGVGGARHRVAAEQLVAADPHPERAELPRPVPVRSTPAPGGTSSTNDRVSSVSCTTCLTRSGWKAWRRATSSTSATGTGPTAGTGRAGAAGTGTAVTRPTLPVDPRTTFSLCGTTRAEAAACPPGGGPPPRRTAYGNVGHGFRNAVRAIRGSAPDAEGAAMARTRTPQPPVHLTSARMLDPRRRAPGRSRAACSSTRAASPRSPPPRSPPTPRRSTWATSRCSPVSWTWRSTW